MVKKVLISTKILTLLLGLIGFTGCLLQETQEAHSATFEFSSSIPDTVSLGDSIALKALVKSTAAPTSFNYKVIDPNGKKMDPASKKVFVVARKITGERKMEWKLSEDEGAYLQVKEDFLDDVPCGGKYTVIVQVGITEGEASKLMGEDSLSFYLDAPACGTDGTLKVDLEKITKTLGAQASSKGSAIDLDEMNIYDSSMAISNKSKVDLFFLMDDFQGVLKLVTPSDVADLAFYDATVSFTGGTVLYETSVDFTKIKSQWQVKHIAKTLLKESPSVSVGKRYVAKTSNGYVLFKVDSKEGGETRKATVTLSGYKVK